LKTITVAAAVILNEHNQLLLVRKQNTHAFMQVGGKLETNEAPEITMQREILEEIGCECELKQFIEAGAITATLGETILRTSTAGGIASAILLSKTRWLN
jgi:8-oxo-dGTP pyrophosphatase MutT (NUDIX family)